VQNLVGLVGPVPDHQFISNLVADDVAFGPQNLGLERAEINRRVDAALKMVSMEDYAQYPPYLLSGGQKQRVCLAGVLAMQPRYLILDEATSMLDPAGRQQVLEILAKLRQERKIGILLITQNLEEALLADRVAIMHQGRIAIDLPFRELAASPDLLKEYGMEEPPLLHMASLLKKHGLLPNHCFPDSLDQVVKALC
jgi:energy-coupling factor transport system ATP-binding protein